MYHLKDKEGLKKFKEITSEDSFLSSVFTEEGNIETQTKYFLKRLVYFMSKSFKKIRVNENKKNKDLEELFNLRRILKTKKDDESCEKLVEVETKLANICADENARTIQEACEGLSCEGGGINAGKLWKLTKQLKGMSQSSPTAMLDEKRNLVTTSKALGNLTVEMFSERLKSHTIKSNLKMHQLQKERLCESRMREAQNNTTPDWTSDNMELALKQLKNNKSRDPLGFANEVFIQENACVDLKQN